MFKNNKIKNRVMEVLNQKIDEAQSLHDEHCKELDEQLEKDKASNLDSIVSSFVSKFL